MDERPDWTELLFSSAGRLQRAPFTALAAVLIGLGFICRASGGPWFAVAPVYALLLFCAAAIACKRLHDRGRSGWWALVPVAAVAALWTPAPLVLQAPAWLGLAWTGLELCLSPGARGANRYGPAPGPAASGTGTG